MVKLEIKLSANQEEDMHYLGSVVHQLVSTLQGSIPNLKVDIPDASLENEVYSQSLTLEIPDQEQD